MPKHLNFVIDIEVATPQNIPSASNKKLDIL